MLISIVAQAIASSAVRDSSPAPVRWLCRPGGHRKREHVFVDALGARVPCA